MKPLLLDTSVWIEWLHGRRRDLVESSKGRLMFLASPVELELYAGAHSAKEKRLLEALLSPFARHSRLVVPTPEDYRRAGEALSEVGLPASKHGLDALICVCSRMIGAELWTLNRKDFLPLSQVLQVTLGTL